MTPDRVPGPEVVAEGVTVAFGRGASRLRAVDDLSVQFYPGITGLVGPNGAGKTTLLRALCGLVPLHTGSIRVGGEEPGVYVASHGIGFLPEAPPLPDFMTLSVFLAGIPGASSGVDGDATGVPGLEALMGRKLGTLSMGQKKKAAVCAALCRDPGLVIMDEPTNGLDPSAVREMRELLGRLAGAGRTVIVSSHHLDELQRVADTVIFMARGRTLGVWSRSAALARFGSFDALYQHLFPAGSA